MAWNTVSTDEQQWTEEQYRKLKLDPPRKVVEALDDVISFCLTQLGVDCNYPDTIPMQEATLGITCVEITEKELPFALEMLRQQGLPLRWSDKVLGTYIVQGFVVRFFVPDPFIEGKDAVVQGVDFDSQTVVKEIRVALR